MTQATRLLDKWGYCGGYDSWIWVEQSRPDEENNHITIHADEFRDSITVISQLKGDESKSENYQQINLSIREAEELAMGLLGAVSIAKGKFDFTDEADDDE